MASTPRIDTIETDIDAIEAKLPIPYQTKFLLSPVSTDITMTDMTFNNLEIGKQYRVTLHTNMLGTWPSNDPRIKAVHDSATVLHTEFNNADGVGFAQGTGNSAIFEATATTLTFVSSRLGGGDTINGDGTRDQTWAQLEELSNHVVTTQWT